MLCDFPANVVAWLPHVTGADGVAVWPQAAGEARAPNGDETNVVDGAHACGPEIPLPKGDADEPVKLLPNGDRPRAGAAELPKGALFSARLTTSSRESLFGAVKAVGTELPKGEATGTVAFAESC